MQFVVVALAVWRISSLLVHEEGPWDVFVRWRALIGVKYDEVYSLPYGKNMFASLFTCVWCLSVWVGLVAAVVYLINGAVATAISLPFAFSAVAVVIDELVNKKR